METIYLKYLQYFINKIVYIYIFNYKIYILINQVIYILNFLV